MPTSPRTDSNRTSGTSSRRTNRADSEARDNIINMLKDDHKRAKKAFRDFEKLDAQDDPACQALVSRTLAELEIHADLEEEMFYPAARKALSDDALIDEAEVEHMTFRTLMAQLKQMKPSDDKYSATFTVLGEYVKHHAKEEESEMFPSLSGVRIPWGDLWQKMQQAREEMMAKQGLSEEPGQRSASSNGHGAEADAESAA